MKSQASVNISTKQRKKLPDTPGVYFFLGKSKKILYIGRATSLRNRIRSYFTSDIAEKRSPWIAKMLAEAKSIDFRKTDSVLEAILLEADLIKKFQPPYNTDEKDDKSFSCVVITKEAFPQVLLVRKKDINFSSLEAICPAEARWRRRETYKLKAIFGPFPHGAELQVALKMVRRIFPYRDQKCMRAGGPTGKPCFNRQIGLCPGTCTGEITQKEYAKTIRNVRLFFLGRKSRLMKLLSVEMKVAARRQEFEKAGEIKRQMFALKHIQDVALLKTLNSNLLTSNYRIEAYDLSHFGGKEIVGAMTVVEGGVKKPSEYRLFKMRDISEAHETLGLKELLRRRCNHPEWKFPELIVVDGNDVQKKAAEEALRSLGQTIPVVALVKDERHRPRELLGDAVLIQKHRGAILLANSEAHRFVLGFQRKQRMIV